MSHVANDNSKANVCELRCISAPRTSGFRTSGLPNYQRRKTPPEPWKRRRKKRIRSWPNNRWTPPHKRLPHKLLFQQRLKPPPQTNILVSKARYLSAAVGVRWEVLIMMHGIRATGAVGSGISGQMYPTNMCCMMSTDAPVTYCVSGALISKSHRGSQITATGGLNG